MQGWVGAGGSGMERCPENANFLGLSLFCSSQTLKVLRGFNHFVILKEKRWEAPKKDSIFWRFWETQKIEASQHFGTLGPANTKRPQSFGGMEALPAELPHNLQPLS